jgi:hypothetical protein
MLTYFRIWEIVKLCTQRSFAGLKDPSLRCEFWVNLIFFKKNLCTEFDVSKHFDYYVK